MRVRVFMTKNQKSSNTLTPFFANYVLSLALPNSAKDWYDSIEQITISKALHHDMFNMSINGESPIVSYIILLTIIDKIKTYMILRILAIIKFQLGLRCF